MNPITKLNEKIAKIKSELVEDGSEKFICYQHKKLLLHFLETEVYQIFNKKS